METNRFNQFYTIYQTSNLRKAAELLGISHSGLSKSMTILERELDKTLFLPSGRGISFTDEGHKLATKIPHFLDELKILTAKESDKERKILHIGSFEVFTTYFAKSLKPMFGEYDLDFHELIPGRMEKALLEREIDLAITYEPIPMPGIEHLNVNEIEMGAFIQKGAFKGMDITAIPFAAPLMPVEGAPTGIRGLDSWPDDRVKRNIKFRVELMETAISLARQGHCAVFIPTFIAKFHNEIIKEKFQLVRKSTSRHMEVVKRKVYLVKRESTVEDSRLKKVAKYLRSL